MPEYKSYFSAFLCSIHIYLAPGVRHTFLSFFVLHVNALPRPSLNNKNMIKYNRSFYRSTSSTPSVRADYSSSCVFMNTRHAYVQTLTAPTPSPSYHPSNSTHKTAIATNRVRVTSYSCCCCCCCCCCLHVTTYLVRVYSGRPHLRNILFRK